MQKLPPDAQQSLTNFLMVRPEVKGDIPGHLGEHEGANGWLAGDGRPEREVQLGFRPEFVVYTIPPFPDGPRGMKNGVFQQPPLHAQPKTTEKGFFIPPHLNHEGDFFCFVAWKPKEPKPKEP